MVPNLSKTQLEATAQEWLKQYGKYDGRMLRLEHSLEVARYRIEPVPGLAEIAEAYIPAKSHYIFVDETQYLSNSPRWRFTLAEELAHDLIHRPMFAGLNSEQIVAYQESLTDDEYSTIERQAKRLAGCLLMPEDVFIERFQHHWDTQRPSVTSDLKLLKYVIRQLNFDFAVSHHAIAVRAVYLDLIDQSQFDDFMETLSPRNGN